MGPGSHVCLHLATRLHVHEGVSRLGAQVSGSIVMKNVRRFNVRKDVSDQIDNREEIDKNFIKRARAAFASTVAHLLARLDGFLSVYAPVSAKSDC